MDRFAVCRVVLSGKGCLKIGGRTALDQDLLHFGTAEDDLFAPGRNCWRVERAGRFSIIVDAADYFRAAKDAMLKARRTIYLIGWDFDTRISFEPGGKTLEGPNKLGPFLRWLDRNRPGLRVYVLKWDLGALQTLSRGTTPLFIMNWMTSKRVRFKLDSAHPLGAAHHQKIVVIDDVLAFCGGLDMTANRWDTRDHRDFDPRRLGHQKAPWHDSTTAVDGAVAKAIAELARERWLRATGEALPEPEPLPPIWPDRLRPSLVDVDVAIARTIPVYADQKEIREVERLYLDSIARARHTIYCETQYFASDRVTEAIIARLQEPDGPEIVVINPDRAEGLVGSEVMDTNRSRLLTRLLENDRYDRFRIYYPVTRRGRPIYVHAKVLVVDDRLLRVGSSNLNNRSMGYDTECDIAVAAGEDDGKRRKTIEDIRNDLIGEHLGTTKARVAQSVAEAGGSLIAAIEALTAARQGLPERSLRPIVVEENGVLDRMVAECPLLDPDRPPVSWPRLRRAFRRLFG